MYVVNWRLAGQSVDYLAAGDAPSAVQHFWSLAVEEQFYVLWPLLILALVWLRRRTGWSMRKTMLGGIAVIGIPSLLWSIYLTETSPGPAYFVSTTRLWELAIGAALAIVASRLARLPATAGHLLGVLGLAAIAYAALTFDESTSFPGAAALVPTLGAAAVIAAGVPGRRTAAGYLLDTSPMRDIGTLSYSLYLWHWPLLVGATAVLGRDDGTLWLPVGVLVIGFSVVPAWLTYRLVEAPIHYSRMFARFPVRAAGLGAACTAVGVAAAVFVSYSIPAPVYASDAEAPGAAVLGDDPGSDPAGKPVDEVEVMVPDVLSAPDDIATLDGERCISKVSGTKLEPCEYGPAASDITVALVGDSKMHQWLPAFEQLADQRGWHLVTYLKSACPLVHVPVEFEGAANKDCAAYNEARYDTLLTDESIDYVVTSQVQPYAYPDGDVPKDERLTMMADDLRDTWQQLEAAGRDVIVMTDNPGPTVDEMECVAQHEDELSKCAFSRTEGEKHGGTRAQRQALDGSEGIGVVDLGDYICPGGTCPAVIGNVLLYRQGSHLTATYVESLSSRLDEAMIDAMKAD